MEFPARTLEIKVPVHEDKVGHAGFGEPLGATRSIGLASQVGGLIIARDAHTSVTGTFEDGNACIKIGELARIYHVEIAITDDLVPDTRT